MGEQVDGEGGIAAGYQNGDICMVDSTPEGLGLGFPGNSVINSATCEQSNGRERENPQSNAPLEAIGGSNKDQTRHKANWGHNQVDKTP